MKSTKIKLSIVAVLIFFIVGKISVAQNIAINSTGNPANISALLDVDATNLGILIPRVALASATTTVTIASPATSLLVYNDGTGGLSPAGYYYNSGTPGSPVWVQLITGGAWVTLGNEGTTAANFVGTTDNVSLRFRTNNTEKMIIDSVGNVGIGTTLPKNALSVKGGSISMGSDAVALGAVNNLIIAGTLGGATSGGGIYDASDNAYLAGDYRAYIQNGMKIEGDILVESGKVGIGTTTPGSFLHTATSTTALGLTIYEHLSGSTVSHDLNFRKARGTIASPTVITSSDELGNISFKGYPGAGGYVTGASIKSFSEGTIASTRVPAHLSFWTGTDAAPTVLTERMRIDSAGKVGIASTSPLSTLTVNGSIAAKYQAGNTITAAATDFFINLNAAGTSTLPAANTVAAGTLVIVRNTTASAITLNRTGTDTMCNFNAVGCAFTTVSVLANSVVRYVSDGTSLWVGW